MSLDNQDIIKSYVDNHENSIKSLRNMGIHPSDRQIGNQWIEIIDGQEHMVKAVEPFELCQGCLFNCNQGGCWWKGFDSCQMGNYFIIKDLGILNKDGCLPAPWDKELYPDFYNASKTLWCIHAESNDLEMKAVGNSKQEAIDTWNRRV